MNTIFVKQVNKFIRDKRPYITNSNLCDIFQSGDLLEIGFKSKQCKNDFTGSCIMCDYGRSYKVGTIQAYLEEMNLILKTHSKGIRYLLLCSNGSILDEYQISTELLMEILKKAQHCNIPNIIIETHYQDVTIDRLNLIKSIINKPVIIEMGLETVNLKYQKTLFMKGINLEQYTKTINRIQSYGFDVELNLMLGLPFLSRKEQLEDTIQSINWAICHKCTPVVFPINIKPHTLLRYAYDKGFYQPVSIWLLILLLDSLEPNALSCTLIAWYGNRDESYPDDIQTILPESCDNCRNLFVSFVQKFLNTKDYHKRKLLLKKLINNSTCTCYQKIKREIKQSKNNFEENYSHFYLQLQKDCGKIISEGTNK